VFRIQTDAYNYLKSWHDAGITYSCICIIVSDSRIRVSKYVVIWCALFIFHWDRLCFDKLMQSTKVMSTTQFFVAGCGYKVFVCFEPIQTPQCVFKRFEGYWIQQDMLYTWVYLENNSKSITFRYEQLQIRITYGLKRFRMNNYFKLIFVRNVLVR